jgi:hypothetical protein
MGLMSKLKGVRMAQGGRGSWGSPPPLASMASLPKVQPLEARYLTVLGAAFRGGPGGGAGGGWVRNLKIDMWL